jgi:hypothetical protein
MNKVEKKIYRIFMATIFTIGGIMFVILFLKSNSASSKWIEFEIQEKTIIEYVYIGKSVFIQLDTFWFSVSYNPVFKESNPIGCIFNKEKGGPYYNIICNETTMNIWTGSGGVVADKIWLRRIKMALEKDKRRKEKLKH